VASNICRALASGIIRAAHAINSGRSPAVPTRRWDPHSSTLVEDGAALAGAGVAGAGAAAGVGAGPSAGAAAAAVAATAGGLGLEHRVTETWDGADCVWITLPDDSPAGYEVVPHSYKSPCHPTHVEPLCLELNGIL